MDALGVPLFQETSIYPDLLVYPHEPIVNQSYRFPFKQVFQAIDTDKSLGLEGENQRRPGWTIG